VVALADPVQLAAEPGEASELVRLRVAAARSRLLAGAPTRTAEAEDLLFCAVERVSLSGRGRARVARVAQTIAALAESAHVLPEHLAEALSYRTPRELDHA